MAFLSFDDGSTSVANLLLRSEQFDNAAWTKNTGTTVTPNAVLAPDGTTTADAIVYDGSGLVGNYRIYQTIAAPALGAPFTASIWLRASSVIGAQLGNNLALTPITITSSWQRFTVSGVGDGSAAGQLLLYSPAGVNTAFTVYAWGAQAELSGYATAYLPTTTAAVGGNSLHNDYVGTPASRFSNWLPSTKPYGDSVNTLASGALVMFRHRTDYGASFDLADIPVRAQVDQVNRAAMADRLIAHLLSGGTCLVQTDDRNATIYKTCGLAPGSSPSLRLTDRRNLLYTLSLQLINLAASPVRMDAVYAP